ncbi:hypothetical protein GCM10022419_058470 [Nonomuraea rosea]|uniref:Serine/threonine protein phosphatase n=1 Tax=Nonomuraea rosea TaxID=638574 RepID=A0ABP6XN73_9ACTN
MTTVLVEGVLAGPGDGTVWWYDDDDVLALGVWTERSRGGGEDAEPLFAHRVPAAEGILGVFDGLGGSGAGAACELSDGTTRSGAWVGARLARLGVASWFLGGLAPESLRTRLVELLGAVPPPRPSKIVSSMRRWLPTTMAAVRYRLTGDQAECRVLWAGDSRAYVLSPHQGLQALTRDHTDETDGLEQLVRDPPMTNVICADQEFTIDAQVLLLPLPSVLVCATDGFHGYVDTPAHFECHLLSTMQEARDTREWAERLARHVSGYTGDDASLSLVALGYADFDRLRSGFAQRARQVEAHYGAGDRPAEERAAGRWRTRTWDEYRPDYERLMPPPAEPL